MTRWRPNQANGVCNEEISMLTSIHATKRRDDTWGQNYQFLKPAVMNYHLPMMTHSTAQ